jgi:hypothetical protein
MEEDRGPGVVLHHPEAGKTEVGKIESEPMLPGE